MSTDVQRRLDDEIAALTSMLCSLCTQRNALSPVSRLPPEILASIFIHCTCSPHKNRWGIPDWVSVSYVCHHWRKVALNCSILWSFLFVSSERWTDELLVRSKTAPLKICVDFPYPNPCHREWYLLEKVASQACQRIQDLRLRFLAFGDANAVLSLLSPPAPLLQALQISVETRSKYLEITALPDARAPFGGYAQALRKLELTNYTFPLTSPTLRGLTSLTLRYLRPSFQPTIASLNDALGGMQDLAHLHLENALPSACAKSADQFPPEVSQKLRLPKLTRLLVVAPFTTVVVLLSCFDIPLKTEVRLRCCFEANAEDRTPIYPLLAKRFIASEGQTSHLVPTIRICFSETTSTTVGFIFSTAERDCGRRAFSAYTTSYEPVQLHEDWDCNIPLKVDVVLRTSLPGDLEDLVEGVYRHLPLTNLQSAHFSCDSLTDFSSGFWTGTFGHLPELRHIKLSGVSLKGLIRALSPNLHFPRDRSESLRSVHTFSSTLKELEFHKMPFSKACNGRLWGDPDCCVCSVQCLRDALSHCRTEGHTLERLVLVECMHVCDHDVRDLKDSVTDVDWDGVTRTIPALESEDEDDVEGFDDRHSGRFGATRIHAFT